MPNVVSTPRRASASARSLPRRISARFRNRPPHHELHAVQVALPLEHTDTHRAQSEPRASSRAEQGRPSSPPITSRPTGETYVPRRCSQGISGPSQAVGSDRSRPSAQPPPRIPDRSNSSCWASILGGCGTRSREHYPSKSLWKKHDAVTVRGFPWCAKSYKTVGLNSLTSHILCAPHNSGLSSVDNEANRFWNTVDQINELHRIRRSYKRGAWSTKHWCLDGNLLERWFTKTSIDLLLLLGDESPWSLDDPAKSRPPAKFVECAFGHTALQEPQGLYASATIGARVMPDEHYGFHVVEASGCLLATCSEFRGFTFLLWLAEEPAVARHVGPNQLSAWLGAELLYHPLKVRFADSSQSLELLW